ncbi:GspH/FimT family pseudopilin [Marinobacter sp. M3C]|jgi:type IV fimbrial biogenesis protein FimT|uniref:GspH/FimT family pseudopilin n=1 Tax=Marinobacter sp. M3C TaxID=2917715 RepID=UPI00200FE12F|nr:GspH/FimT family pseudopilin [Marinobacter sp. M3C]MCL1486328.1 GspH/FimT family pseudopilin [Marinobacter sp.]UQG61934.1 GspH/FimT family pseudopilin [Marinobacter sp. M3C]
MKYAAHGEGFTLPELMICVAIITIVLSFTLPAFDQVVRSNKADQVRNDLLTLFNFARLEAIHQQQLITVCPLDNSGICHNDWSGSITVFIDDNKNGRLDSHELTLRRIDVDLGQWKLTKRPASRAHFQFDTIGTANGTAGSVEFCHPLFTEGGRALVISFAGRVRTSADFNGDGIEERSPGTPISC